MESNENLVVVSITLTLSSQEPEGVREVSRICKGCLCFGKESMGGLCDYF